VRSDTLPQCHPAQSLVSAARKTLLPLPGQCAHRLGTARSPTDRPTDSRPRKSSSSSGGGGGGDGAISFDEAVKHLPGRLALYSSAPQRSQVPAVRFGIASASYRHPYR